MKPTSKKTPATQLLKQSRDASDHVEQQLMWPHKRWGVVWALGSRQGHTARLQSTTNAVYLTEKEHYIFYPEGAMKYS